MSNAKHTPGPWIHHDGTIYQAREDGGKLYAEMAIAGVFSREDARLIAAAPELLEALNSMLPDLKRYAYSVLHDDDLAADLAAELHDVLIAKHKAALAIVAKATGAKP